MIELINISHQYQLGKNAISALNNISLRIAENEIVAVKGASGSGKSTLLNVIGCLLKQKQGDVKILNKSITLLNDRQKSKFRRNNIGFVFQSFNLLPVLSVYENIEYPLILKGIKKNIRRKMVFDITADVGLIKHIHHKPDQLSGGQQQGVSIARALVTSPKFILADEPTANLDSQATQNILKLIFDINKNRGTSFVLSTHDPIVYNAISHVITMRDGKII